MEIQACRVCLSTESHLLRLAENDKSALEDVVGYKINLNTSLPKYICKHCKARIHQYSAFKRRCHFVQNQLDTKLVEGLPSVLVIHITVVKGTDSCQILSEVFLNAVLEIKEEETQNDVLNTEDPDDIELTQNYVLTTEDPDDKEIKNENISDSNVEVTYEDEDLIENDDLENDKDEETRNEVPKAQKSKINDEVINDKIFSEHKATKRVSKRLCNKTSPLKKRKTVNSKTVDKSEQKANKLVKSNIKSKSKPKTVKGGNWNKLMIEQSLKKYNMKLKILTREEQVEKILARKETDKYKHSRLKCELCYKTYSSDKAFENHNTLHRPSGQRPVKCEVCHLYFSGRTLRDHMRSHRTEVLCLECGEGVTTVQMKKHYDFHAGVKFECVSCKKMYHKKSTYMSHLRAHHADVVCTLCADVYYGQRGMFVHVKKSHLEEALEQCDGCQHYFSTTKALQRHLNTKSCSHNISPCGWCGVTTADAKALAAHIATKHRRPSSLKDFVCTECNSRFKMEAALLSHWRKVHQEKTDRQIEAAKAHRDNLKGKNSVICEQCGAMLISSCHLRMHMMKHTGEKPHQCDVCHKSFRLLTTLKSHMMVHSGEKPYRCAQCPNAYRQTSHLKMHMRTHTGEKPYLCDVCAKAFACKSNRDEHQRTVHAGLPPRHRKGRAGKQPGGC